MSRQSGEDDVTDTLWSLHDRETDPVKRAHLREAVSRIAKMNRESFCRDG